MGCEHMYNESQKKEHEHDSIMEQARRDPDAVLRKIRQGQGQPPIE